MTKDVVKSVEIGDDYIKICYYGGCGRKFNLSEPLTEDELNDLVTYLNAENIGCESEEDKSIITEDNC
jgi:type III secretory pathway lipoprotein EscJ